MKRNPKSAKAKAEAIQVWTLAQAQAAVPYISSIVRSLREYALDLQKNKLLLEKLGQLSGRPKAAIRSSPNRKPRPNWLTPSTTCRTPPTSCNLSTSTLLTLFAVRHWSRSFTTSSWRGTFSTCTTCIRSVSGGFQSDSDETRRPITSKQNGLGGADSPILGKENPKCEIRSRKRKRRPVMSRAVAYASGLGFRISDFYIAGPIPFNRFRPNGGKS